MTCEYTDAVHAYVERHLSEPIAVQEIAQSVGLHPSYLNTRFRTLTGSSVKQYVHQRKTDEAKRLLRETGLSLSQIGSMLGYFDQSHFTRVFKRYAGMTPAQFRMR